MKTTRALLTIAYLMGLSLFFANASQAQALSATATIVNHASCHGTCDGKAYVTASGGTAPYTYQWDTGMATDTARGLCAGTFHTTVTDNLGATAVDSIIITEPVALALNITTQATSSAGNCDGSATLSVFGGTSPYSYLWNTAPPQTTNNPVNLCSGSYTVTVIDQHGCIATTGATVHDPLSAHIVLVQNAVCNGLCNGKAYIDISGGNGPISFFWSDGSLADTNRNMCAGSYLVSVTDSSGASVTDTITITEPLPVVATAANAYVLCNGNCDGVLGTSASGGSAPFSYAWSIGAATDTIRNLCAGVYTATVADANGCSTTVNDTVYQPTALAVSVQVTQPPSTAGSCDGSATVTATGGVPPYTYDWGNPLWVSSGPTAASLCDGTYQITVTDANGCVYNDTETFHANNTLTVDAILIRNVSCFGMNDGEAYAVANGTPPYTYNWSNGTINDTLDNTTGGTYYVTVTDNMGIWGVDSIAITEPPLLIVTTTVVDDSSCGGVWPNTTGSVTAHVSGGTPGYTYAWSNAANTNPINLLPPSIYIGTITDANGCSVAVTDTVHLAPGICDVWPGDANNDGVADNFDVLDIGQGYGYTGLVRTNASLVWTGQPAAVWTDTLPDGNNAKYADCDGNGTINADDTLAVTLNYGLTHQKTDAPSKLGPELYIEFPAVDSTQAGLPVQVPIYLGDSSNPLTDIYGIAFSVNYDTTLVKENSFQLTAGNCWLGTPGVNLLTFGKDLYSQAKTDITIVRTNHSNTNGFGPLCTTIYVMKDDISGKDQITRLFSPTISNVRAIKYDGSVVPIDESRTDTIVVTQDAVGIAQPSLSAQIKLYPNPAGDYLVLDAGSNHITQYTITDLLGKELVSNAGGNSSHTTINTSSLARGMYLLQIWSGQQKAVVKFSVVR